MYPSIVTFFPSSARTEAGMGLFAGASPDLGRFAGAKYRKPASLMKESAMGGSFACSFFGSAAAAFGAGRGGSEGTTAVGDGSGGGVTGRALTAGATHGSGLVYS